MDRQKVDYGIDLGTTNSAIARMQDGRPVVLKNDMQKDTTPSCVYFTRSGQLCVGEEALKRFKRDVARGECDRARLEFKRRMGTDETFRFPGVERTFTPEELSAEVLKALAGQVGDEPVDAAVIAVPAAFGQNEVEATQRAAELAGFAHVDLTPEPLAASLAYSLQQGPLEGHWLVYDLGGGTFDAVLMRMHEGIMRTVDIAGDTRLGGKDIDDLIVDKVLLPAIAARFCVKRVLADPAGSRRLRGLLKWLYAEDAKIRLSREQRVRVDIEEELLPDDQGKPICDVSVELDRAQLESLAAPLLDRTIVICRELLERNHVPSADVGRVLLVGGPTLMPCVRDRLRERLGVAIDVSVDPMTAVAIGAAVYASTRDRPVTARHRERSAVHLQLAFPETTVEQRVTLGVRVEQTGSVGSGGLCIEVVRADAAWRSDRTALQDGVAVLELPLEHNRANVFEVRAFGPEGRPVAVTPSRFTVIQGMKVDNPPLPFDICVEVSTAHGDRLQAIVRRGQVVPAIGSVTGLRTKFTLRPGHRDDVVAIPLYEGEEGSRAICNRFLGDLRITGDMVSAQVPPGSEVRVTVRMDESRRKTVSAYIEYTDQTFEAVMEPLQKERFDPEALRSGLAAAAYCVKDMSEKLGARGNGRIASFEQALAEVRCAAAAGTGEREAAEAAVERLRILQRRLDEYEKSMAAALACGNLRNQLEIVETEVLANGDSRTQAELASLREQCGAALQTMDAAAADQLARRLVALWWRVVENQPDFWLDWLYRLRADVEHIAWTDETQARELIQQGSRLSADGYRPELRAVVRSLWRLRPGRGEECTRADLLEVGR